jgi:hypothetical protein
MTIRDDYRARAKDARREAGATPLAKCATSSSAPPTRGTRWRSARIASPRPGRLGLTRSRIQSRTEGAEANLATCIATF